MTMKYTDILFICPVGGHCQLRNMNDLTKTANLVNSLSVLKDLIFEPITLIDY